MRTGDKKYSLALCSYFASIVAPEILHLSKLHRLREVLKPATANEIYLSTRIVLPPPKITMSTANS